MGQRLAGGVDGHKTAENTAAGLTTGRSAAGRNLNIFQIIASGIADLNIEIFTGRVCKGGAFVGYIANDKILTGGLGGIVFHIHGTFAAGDELSGCHLPQLLPVNQ